MRDVLLAVGSGVVGALVATVFMTPSMATSDAELAQAGLSPVRCKATVTNTYVSYNWCNVGDVQTGTYNDSIYCGKIEVTCP